MFYDNGNTSVIQIFVAFLLVGTVSMVLTAPERVQKNQILRKFDEI